MSAAISARGNVHVSQAPIKPHKEAFQQQSFHGYIIRISSKHGVILSLMGNFLRSL
jgi:hypothetical protein